MLPVALAHEIDLGMRDRLLYELARDLSSSLDLDVVLEKVMDRVITLMKAARGFIVLLPPTRSQPPCHTEKYASAGTPLPDPSWGHTH